MLHSGSGSGVPPYLHHFWEIFLPGIPLFHKVSTCANWSARLKETTCLCFQTGKKLSVFRTFSQGLNSKPIPVSTGRKVFSRPRLCRNLLRFCMFFGSTVFPGGSGRRPHWKKHTPKGPGTDSGSSACICTRSPAYLRGSDVQGVDAASGAKQQPDPDRPEPP